MLLNLESIKPDLIEFEEQEQSQIVYDQEIQNEFPSKNENDQNKIEKL
jgi:hypothetical protein